MIESPPPYPPERPLFKRCQPFARWSHRCPFFLPRGNHPRPVVGLLSSGTGGKGLRLSKKAKPNKRPPDFCGRETPLLPPGPPWPSRAFDGPGPPAKHPFYPKEDWAVLRPSPRRLKRRQWKQPQANRARHSFVPSPPDPRNRNARSKQLMAQARNTFSSRPFFFWQFRPRRE